MIRAYLFALDPTDAQAEAMRSHCGAARVAYNWYLARVKANWEQRAAEQTYGLSGDQLTPWVDTSAYGLRKAWNAAKNQVAPWWADNSKEAYATGCANLAAALGNRRAGRARMPRFKSKRRARPACRFTTGSIGLGADRRHIRLPVIGAVRTAESTRKLARKLEAGTARIRSATLSFQRGRWHVSFSVELPAPEPAPRTGGRVLGVDLGITTLATLSTGRRVPNGRRLDAELARLRRAQRRVSRRRGPDRRTGQVPSQRWRKARARADRIHTRVANLRRDDTHQFTSRLVRAHDVIVIEDLHVAGMLRNKRLARHIAGAAWGEIRRQLSYKAERAATARTQGDRPNDYHWCIEGELVRIGEVCARDRADPDGGCGCGRGFGGLNSHRATTTARIAEVPLTREEYAEAIRSSLQQQGWDACACSSTDEADEADGLAALVADWPVGSVVERRIDELMIRSLGAG